MMRKLSVSDLSERWLLPAAITLLTLADGALHLRLDWLLFGGTVWGQPAFGGGHGPGGPPGPPSGARPGGPPPGGGSGMPFPFSLNEMFFLNFLTAVALVLAFWTAYRWFRRWLWLVDAAIAGFAAYAIWGWFQVGKPNPQNLGHITKGIEAALIVLVVAHVVLALRRLNLRAYLPRGLGQRPAAH
jgi:hypothetical protein